MDPFNPAAPLGQRWYTQPAGISAILGAAGAVGYGTWIIGPAPGWTLPIWLVGMGIAVVAAVAVELRARRGMPTWRRISQGTLPATVEHLQRAAVEVYALPDRLFVARLQQWVAAGILMALYLRWRADWISWAQTLRVAAIGAVFGPIVALAAHFPMVRRTRLLIAHLSRRGLSGQQLAAAIPSRRFGLRARLVLMGVILAGVPTLLMSDAATVHGERQLQTIAGIAEPAARAAQVEAAVAALRLDALIIAIAFIALTMLIATFIGHAITDPIRRLAENARRISQGEVGAERLVVAEDELWTLAASLLHTEGQLADLLKKLQEAGLQISSTTEQIVLTSSKHEQGAARQATALAQTSSTTEELARSARSIASNASEVATIAQRTLDSAEEARSNAQAFASAMDRMKSGNAAVAESVRELNTRVGQIGKIVEFINSIADKSDLLALNAELEGVKAGEVGRAFSLVATEMRRMAENVTRSTREIEELIDQIREATKAAVSATELGVRTTEGSAAVVGAMSQSLSTIAELAGLTTEAVKTISSATQQQQTGTDQLASAMGDILGVTRETEQATQAIILTNVDLVRLAKELQDAVERFRVDGAQPARRSAEG